MSLKLISINIERSKHLDTVLPFIQREQPDVLCVQELMEPDIAAIQEASKSVTHRYLPMSRLLAEHPGKIYGAGIFSRLPVLGGGERYYVGPADALPEEHPQDPATFNNENRAVLYLEVLSGGAAFRIATTHFTWTPDGSASEEQRTNVRSLVSVLETMDGFILCGDFNAPRGGEIFETLAARYADNIPSVYDSSLDPVLHRAGHLKRMVDGLFTTPEYACSGVRLVSGVSDHMAIVADIEKATPV